MDSEKIIERFLKTDLGRRLMADAERDEFNLEKRKAAAAELAELKRGRAAVMDKFDKMYKDAWNRVAAERESLGLAVRDAKIIESRVYGEQWQYDQKILEKESFLMSSAPEDLRIELARLEEKLDRTRSKPIANAADPDIPTALTGFRTVRGGSGSEIAERTKELAEIAMEIETAKSKIYGGE